MNELTNNKNLKDKLESFLNRACEAEAQGDYVQAERLFRLALYCDGRLRPDVTNAKEYAETAGSVYKKIEAAG